MMNGKIAVFHKTVQGHLHILKNRPCEDASLSFSDEDGQYHIIVVADGHGSRACMRSSYGSQAAVQIAVDCLKIFAATSITRGREQFLSALESPRTIRQMMKQLTDTIISNWYETIHSHLEKTPLTEAELIEAGEYGEHYRSGMRLEHIYGTTLIAALLLPEHLILLQQGDGRCDVFYADGSVEQPIPWDDRCFENVTTSMCDEDAATSIRHCVLSLNRRPIAACYLGSDGVEDSYRDMEGTHTFYRRLSEELIHLGRENFEQYLSESLPKFSEKGSGDDISVAGMVNLDAVGPLLPLFHKSVQRYELLESKRYYDEKINSMIRKHCVLKKRAEEAKADFENSYYGKRWTESNIYVYDMESPRNIDVVNPNYSELCRKYQEAAQEFREYDHKYQEMVEKQQELNLQIDALLKRDSEETAPLS